MVYVGLLPLFGPANPTALTRRCELITYGIIDMKQSTRLILTLVFLFLLLFLSKLLNGSWFYWPPGDQSIWFQSGLLMVVLGSFFIEKHFTKPVDVVANTVIGIVTLLAVEHRDHFIFWSVVIWGMVALAVMAFASMAIQTFSTKPTYLKIGRALFGISTFVGSARRLFSIVLFLAIFSYFAVPSKGSLLILLFWAVVIASEPIGVPALVDRIIDRLTTPNIRIGKVFRVLGRNLYQIEITSDVNLSGENVIQINAPGEKIVCVPLSYVTLTDKRLVTAVTLAPPSRKSDELIASMPDRVFAQSLSAESLSARLQTSNALKDRKNILGIVDDNSDIEQLRFRLYADRDLQEGQLVKVFFGERPVLYQIVNGITKSSTTQGDEERYISVIAQLVGVWDASDCHFESIGWVADPGSIVYFEGSEAEISIEPIGENRAIVGNLPQSNYPIHVEIDEIVTHHTAILGITGSGKTVLAYELIRKMVGRGIKVLVFDVSGDYARDLSALPMVKLKSTGDVLGFLNSDNNLGIAEFQPTSTSTIVKATAQAVQEVLKWAKTKLESQHGENIKAKACVVFEEAHSLIPEWNTVSIQGDKEEVNKTSQAILQGRKYGVGALVITQRTANITKTILNQCNTIFALQSFDQTGLEFLKNYIGEGHAHALSTLLKRQVIIFGKASSSRRPVIAKLREVSLGPPSGSGHTGSASEASSATGPNSDPASSST